MGRMKRAVQNAAAVDVFFILTPAFQRSDARANRYKPS